MKKWTIILGIFALILAAALIAGTQAKGAVPEETIPPMPENSLLVEYDKDWASIQLNVPEGWEYEKEEFENDFCITFWPLGESQGKIKVWYYEWFGVCGTGLKEETIRLGGYEANKGTYDGSPVWDFICLKTGTEGKFVILNEGADAWWASYGKEAMQMLNTLKVAESPATNECVTER